MPQTFPVRSHGSLPAFTKFCNEMKMLPPYTPLFMTDFEGRILERKRLGTEHESFESVFAFAEHGQHSFMAGQGRMCDAYAVRATFDDKKSFIVASKDTDGNLRCVVCSYSENECENLSEYVHKLSSYKTYIDSFSHLAAIPSAQPYIKNLFESRVRGAMSLAGLALGAVRDSEKRVVFPADIAINKLCDCFLGTNSAEIEFCPGKMSRGPVVTAPESFFSLFAGTLALVFRHSLDGKISISVEDGQDNGTVRIHFSSKSRGKTSDIYEKELIPAVEQRGIMCACCDDGEIYSFFMDVMKETEIIPVISDVIEISRRIDEYYSDDTLRDMFYTISGI